jgi:integrase
MACVFKRHRNWYAYFRANGNDFNKSTGIRHTPDDPEMMEPNRLKALAWANQREREERAKAPRADLSTETFLYQFAKERSNDPDTVRRDRNVFDRFMGDLNDLRTGPLTVVSREHVQAFIQMRSSEVKETTFNSELTTLHAAFERAVKLGLMPCNPVDLAKDQLLESSSVRSLEPWQVKALLLATMVLDWRTAIYIGFYTGCQLVDAVYLRWSELLRGEDGRIRLSIPGNEHRAAKLVLVHPVLLKHLESLPKVNEFICPAIAKLERWTADNHFSKVVADAMLEKGVTFRSLRHTHARLIGLPVSRLDTADPEALLALADISVPMLPCQTARG